MGFQWLLCKAEERKGKRPIEFGSQCGRRTHWAAATQSSSLNTRLNRTVDNRVIGRLDAPIIKTGQWRFSCAAWRLLMACKHLHAPAKKSTTEWEASSEAVQCERTAASLLACSLAPSPAAALRFSSFSTGNGPPRSLSLLFWYEWKCKVVWRDRAALLFTILTNSTQYG